jgi:uncharacterized Zn-binding protein involved in type VI secretion
MIVLGDKTSHGGTVITADFTCEINGKYMARVRDMVVCPKCKGIFAIKTGAPDLVDGEGRGYARHMDMTDCGAYLLSGQVTTAWSDESTGGESAGHHEEGTGPVYSNTVAAPTDSGVCLECLVKAAQAGSAAVIRG